MADPVEYAASTDLPSPDELATISKIREACRKEVDALSCRADDVVGDLRICRFLRSRHGDAAEATEWFREFLAWRLEVGMEAQRPEVVGRSPEEFLAWYDERRNPYLRMCPYVGRNADGHILWFISPGRIDPEKFIQHRQVSKEEDRMMIMLVLEWTMWHLDVLSREEGRMVYCIKIADVNGLGCDGRRIPIFVPEFKGFMQDMLKGMQRHYCEHDTMFVLLNTSWTFRAVFSVMKLLLTKRQVAKIRMLGDATDKDVLAVLKRIVPQEILPAVYGGPVARPPGFLPVDSAEEIEAWYQKRHLLPALARSASAASAAG